MGSRLLLLVLFPLTVLTVTLGVVAHERWVEREAAADLVERLDGVRDRVALLAALHTERAGVEVQIRSATFGVPAQLGATLLGLPDVEEAYPATDQAAASAPTPVRDLLEEARVGYLNGAPDAIERYDRVTNLVSEDIVDEVEVMRGNSVAIADADLAREVEQLEAAVVVFSASTRQTTSLADSWFGPEGSRDQSLVDLAFHTAQYELALADLDPARVPIDHRDALVTASDGVSNAVDLAFADELSTPDLASPIDDLPFVIAVFEQSFVRNGLLSDVVAQTSDNVEAVARQTSDEAAGSFVAVLVLGGLAIAASVGFSWRLAASIAGPMASVASRTRDLTEGRIDSLPLALEGPRELRSVAGAINAVTVNLEALDGKLVALSHGDIDDERLAVPLPGRLGETLTKSVDTLSASIADRRNLQARLGYQANHDALTRLSNRAAVLDSLANRLTSADVNPVGLVFVDLDDFKRANDVFGHGTGDEVLVEVADRLQTLVRPSDLVARLGGDEFLILVDEPESLPALAGLASRLVDALATPMALRGTGGLTVDASIGVALCDDHTVDALEFLSHADAALSHAKSHGVGVAVFDEPMKAKLQWRATVEQRLSSALRNGEFDVHYQPVLTSDSLRIGQVEALIRWTGNESYGPDEFIPVAEASHLIIDIDRFVLAQATSDLASLLADNPGLDMSVAVNISGRHLLHADVAKHVASALESSGLEASNLIIEVTETALIADLDRAADHLSQLRSLGVRTSVDDFGTGFTSISQLRRLPVDELKIDRSLVQDLPGDQTLVRVVRELAAHFGLSTVAEGVETAQQAEFLKELGCTRLQGWLYARSMQLADLKLWIGEHHEVAPADRVAHTELP